MRGTSAWQCGHQWATNQIAVGLPDAPGSMVTGVPSKDCPAIVGAGMPIAVSVPDVGNEARALPVTVTGRLSAASPVGWSVPPCASTSATISASTMIPPTRPHIRSRCMRTSCSRAFRFVADGISGFLDASRARPGSSVAINRKPDSAIPGIER